MLNNINSCRISKSKKVFVSNHPGATSELILSAVEETLKTNPSTLMVYAGINNLTKSTNTLRNVKKYAKNKWILESKRDITVSLEDVSNVSSLDGRQKY